MVFLGVHMFLCLEARKMQRRRFPALGGKESGGAASLPINIHYQTLEVSE